MAHTSGAWPALASSRTRRLLTRPLVQETLNVIFTLIFAGEFFAKLFGMGIVEYCADNANLFDGFIVILSIVDLAMLIVGAGEGSGISVLRAFRLFRVFKLVRFFPALEKQLNVSTRRTRARPLRSEPGCGTGRC